MKKYFILTAMAAVVAFACSKVEPQSDEPAKSITYNFTIADKPSFDGQTRAVKTSWVNGDKIYVVFDDHTPTALTDFLILEYSESNDSWDVIQQPSASNQPNAEGGSTLDALYYANPTPTVVQNGSEYRLSSSIDGDYLFSFANNVSYSIDDNGELTSDTMTLSFPDAMFLKFTQFCIIGLKTEATRDWRFQAYGDIGSYLQLAIPMYKNGVFDSKSATQSSSNKAIMIDDKGDGYIYAMVHPSNTVITFRLFDRNDSSNNGSPCIYTRSFNKTIATSTAAKFKGPLDSEGNLNAGWNKE